MGRSEEELFICPLLRINPEVGRTC